MTLSNRLAFENATSNLSYSSLSLAWVDLFSAVRKVLLNRLSDRRLAHLNVASCCRLRVGRLLFREASRQCFAYHCRGRVVLRSFGRGVDPAARRMGAGALLDWEKVLTVYEDRGATGRIEPVLGTDYYRVTST